MKNISPFEIKSKEFKKSLMGLDPNEVRSYLKIISVEWQNLSTKLNELEEEFPAFITNSRGLGLFCAFDLPSTIERDKLVAEMYKNHLMMDYQKQITFLAD